jgi:DNA-binding NarL/FixJ family response regulator
MSLSQPDLPLTPRLREVWDLMCAGLSNAQIAARLFLAPGTIHNYTSLLATRGYRRDHAQR